MWDVIIIGAGVIGCATARELAKYKLHVLVCEEQPDVGCGTSRANSAIIHSGHSAKPGTNMARLNVRGNELYDPLCKELDVGFRRCGSLNIAFSEDELPGLRKLMTDGVKNGVPGMRIVFQKELRRMEPNLGPEALAAVWAPTSGIINPFELTVALAESAARNGVEFRRQTAIVHIARRKSNWCLTTAKGENLLTRTIVNAAGIHSDTINNMVSRRKLRIQGRIGEYWLIDRGYADCFHSTIFQIPGPMGKGILVTPTVDGTVLIGPTCRDTDDISDLSTTQEGLDQLLAVGRRTWPALPRNAAITAFAGMRAHLPEHDFILGEPEDAPGFFNAAGIESPGLSAAPAIAEELANGIVQQLDAEPNGSFTPGRPPMVRYRELSFENRAKLAEENPQYNRVICRCETVTEAEIRDAIRRPVGARTLDGIKRRVRAGAGRCQGGFCMPRVLEILAEELGLSPTAVTRSGGNSYVLDSKIHSQK